MLRSYFLLIGAFVMGSSAFAQNGAPAGSTAPGPTQSIPSGAAPVPGATNPATTPLYPLMSPQSYPSLPADRAPASVGSPQDDPNADFSNPQAPPPVLTWPLWQPRPDPNVDQSQEPTESR